MSVTDSGSMMTVQEVARRLGTSDRNVRYLISLGKLAAYRLGERTIRISEADLGEYLRTVRTA